MHFLAGSVGLYFVYLVYGSISIWEIILFYIATFLPIADEFLYAVVHYQSSTPCRVIVNNFFIGNMRETLNDLHRLRIFLKRLFLHNFFSYSTLWFLWYVFYVFDFTPWIYFLFGIQIHLFFDLLNDFHQYANLNRWLWPLQVWTNEYKAS